MMMECLVDLCCERYFEFIAKGNHLSDQGCAGSGEKVGLIMMLHEGSGEPVSIDGVSEFHVACDEFFRCLLVGLSVDNWVGESSVAVGCFHGLGADCTRSCGADHFGGALGDVIRGVFGQVG